jgi:hypothetical protein
MIGRWIYFTIATLFISVIMAAQLILAKEDRAKARLYDTAHQLRYRPSHRKPRKYVSFA